MSLNCFCDTCSIVWTQGTGVNGPCYQGNVQLAANGSIKCDGGLTTKLTNATPVSQTAECANILRQDPSGQLFAELPLITQTPFGDATNSPVAQDKTTVGDNYQNSPSDHTFVNSYGCDIVVLVRGHFRLDYAILGDGSPFAYDAVAYGERVSNITTDAGGGVMVQRGVTPYNAHWNVQLLSSIDANPPAPILTQNFSTSGVIVVGNDVYQNQSEIRAFTHVRLVPSGSTLHIRGRIAQQGPSENMNVLAFGSGALAGNGFGLATCSFNAFPLRGQEIL